MPRITWEFGRLDQLRLQIHQAALEPELWHDVIGSVMALVGARCANVMLTEAKSVTPKVYVFRNVDPDAQRLFETHWHKHDLWLHASEVSGEIDHRRATNGPRVDPVRERIL